MAFDKEIENIVKTMVSQSLQGQSTERPKFEFKRQWYELNEKKRGYFEFIKDTCAIANTIGEFGLIVIGFDDKTKEFLNPNFYDSGLKDTSNLYDIIVKNIVEPFNIELHNIILNENTLNIIKINQSFSKPHVIKEYVKFRKDNEVARHQNYIPVRKETGIFPANKYDIDLMYYDRKNVLFEQMLSIVSLSLIDLGKIAMFSFPAIQIIVTLENTGVKAIAIRNFTIKLFAKDENIQVSAALFKELGSDNFSKPGDMNIILSPNSIKDILLIFDKESAKHNLIELIKNNNVESYIEAETIRGDQFEERLDIIFYPDKISHRGRRVKRVN